MFEVFSICDSIRVKIHGSHTLFEGRGKDDGLGHERRTGCSLDTTDCFSLVAYTLASLLGSGRCIVYKLMANTYTPSAHVHGHAYTIDIIAHAA